MARHWYLSFANSERFLGGTVVDADNPVAALNKATSNGHNPGGECVIVEIDDEYMDDPAIVICIGRLATEEEMITHGAIRPGAMNVRQDD